MIIYTSTLTCLGIANMIVKPSGCDGCPFAQHGAYFTPDTIVPGSKVMFIAQNPGPDEEAGHRLLRRHYHGGGQHTDEYEQVQPGPLLGATGQLFNARFLPLAQIKRPDVSLGNAIRCRPGVSLGLKPDELPKLTSTMKLEMSQADVVKALKHCRDRYLKVPDSVEVVVAMGRYAMFSLTGIQKEETEYGKKIGIVESWRGYGVDLIDYKNWGTVYTDHYHTLFSEKKVFFMMHLAALFRDKKYFHATLLDFTKLKRLLDKTWPGMLPEWTTVSPSTWPSYAAFDTEYIPDLDNQLVRWSLCDTDDNLYCVEAEESSVIPIVGGSTVLFQNVWADYEHLVNIVDISKVNIEDMMIADSVLYTGERHDLDFIASKHGSLNKWKHLSKDNPQLYSAIDAHQPMHMWKGHYLPAFRADPLSWRIYKKYRLPLVDIINKAQLTGAKTDTDRLQDVQHILKERLLSYQQRAQQLTGDEKFNLGGSKKLKEILYG